MANETRVSDVMRNELLILLVPELFDAPGTILYIGAHTGGFASSQILHAAGNRITVLEIWPNAIETLKASPLSARVSEFILGDVRHLEDVDGLPHFDYTIWLHGPEHISFTDLPNTLAGLEAITTRTIVLACPWGKAPHGWKENQHNKHLSYLEPNDFYRLGYQVAALSPIDRLGGHVLAWKRMNDEEDCHTD